MKTNKNLVKQNSASPTEKMKYVGFGATAATFVMTGIAIKFPESYKAIPPGFEIAVGGAIAGIVAWVAGYLKKEKA